ncbi:RNA polymerase sigma-70 factor [Arthrobacter silvisoli]|uniref:RNA polymerase sigma-70 factor n=1 Tax=Arthrobacter silvisoli TaxID=2291022 RepID=UPI000E212001|nr:RNA polymerase sigma-70 factor [Arthrobacter silvisoli]
MRSSGTTDGLDLFVTHRSLLFTVAYEMLGSAADAEDVVQEAWLRWAGLEPEARAEVREPRSYFVRIVTRQALNRLRTLSRRREEYVGEWLPEPLLTVPDVAEDVELAESVSIAMLTVLESLAPVERAVFVLREVFDAPYEEIAEAVGKSTAAVRQISSRARSHVAARRPRMQVDRTEQQAVVERFLAAVTTGDVQGLMDVLAPDVVLIADGGGVAQAVRVPVYGAKKVANLLRPFPQWAVSPHIGLVWLNGGLGIRIDDEAGGPSLISVVVEDGRVARIFAMRNPDKLGRLAEETLLAR